MSEKQPASLPLVLRTADGDRVLVEFAPFRIGRGTDNDLTLLSADLSTFHAELLFDGEAWTVRDVGSKNGTFVNSRRNHFLGQLPSTRSFRITTNGTLGSHRGSTCWVASWNVGCPMR